jgi:hypothetical protein
MDPPVYDTTPVYTRHLCNTTPVYDTTHTESYRPGRVCPHPFSADDTVNKHSGFLAAWTVLIFVTDETAFRKGEFSLTGKEIYELAGALEASSNVSLLWKLFLVAVSRIRFHSILTYSSKKCNCAAGILEQWILYDTTKGYPNLSQRYWRNVCVPWMDQSIAMINSSLADQTRQHGCIVT